jgi:hypothetical protein
LQNFQYLLAETGRMRKSNINHRIIRVATHSLARLRSPRWQLEDHSGMNDLYHQGKKITVFATHSSAHDIPFLDYAVCKSIKNRPKPYPVGILRDNFRIPLWSLNASQRFLRNSHSMIPFPRDREDRQFNPFTEISAPMKAVFDDGHVLAMFPGGTRLDGLVTSVMFRSMRLYAASIKRFYGAGFYDAMCGVPLSIMYSKGRVRGYLGKAVEFQGRNPATISARLMDGFAQGTRVVLEDVLDAKDWAAYQSCSK